MALSLQEQEIENHHPRILDASARLTVYFKRSTLFSSSSQATILPFPFMRAARWIVLFPGAEQASRTFTIIVEWKTQINIHDIDSNSNKRNCDMKNNIEIKAGFSNQLTCHPGLGPRAAATMELAFP